MPPHRHLPYTGTQRTVNEMLKMAKGIRGAQSLRVRRHTEMVLRHVAPRDTLSQLAALYYHYIARHNYFRDPTESELVKDPEAIIDEMEGTGTFLGDCDDASMYIIGTAQAAGIRALPMRVGFTRSRQVTLGRTPGRQGRVVRINAPYTHVLAVARDQYGRTVALDPVAGLRTHKMLRRTKRFG